MKNFLLLLGCLLLGGVAGAGIYWGLLRQSPAVKREVMEVAVSPETEKQAVSVAANKLPEFTVDLSSGKLSSLLQMAGDIKERVVATVVHEAYANTTLQTELHVDTEKKELVVSPKDAVNFRPGKYRLSLSLRTIEGTVQIDQDFTWGVIAVNTNKSIYKPGDVATIGMGVLNDSGETQCKTGVHSAKVWLTVVDPNGKRQEFSTRKGMCGTVANVLQFR
jgi:hypothetical protein